MFILKKQPIPCESMLKKHQLSHSIGCFFP